MRQLFFSTFSLILFASHTIIFEAPAKQHSGCNYQDENTFKNHIQPRLQWNTNFGYCGETSFVAAGLYYGQYISQYTARSVASPGIPQYLAKSQLLLGVNDLQAAKKLHLQAVEWDTKKEKSTPQFLSWVKKHVLKGFPVIIGVYTNEYLFYGKKNPNAGDPDYDHIVPVFGIGTNRPLEDDCYHGQDIIYFSDNGLWGDPTHPFIFCYPFSSFQATRQEANNKHGEIYSLSNSGRNYGVVIKGVIDLDGDTLPVRVEATPNYEIPEIKEGTNTPPDPMSMTLKITVSNLVPEIEYILYRYDDLDLVPNSQFNAYAENAAQSWSIQITAGSTYTLTQQILSNEIAVYRAVRATAP